MLNIQCDMFKSMWLMIYPIVELSRGAIPSDSALCQASGFFLALAIEVCDLTILTIALHTAMYVFRPRNGLFSYRYLVYLLLVVIPTFLASFPFIGEGAGYVNNGQYCYLPVHPPWYRMGLSWMPRYIIFVTIIAVYAAIYIHVVRTQRRMALLGRRDPRQTTASTVSCGSWSLQDRRFSEMSTSTTKQQLNLIDLSSPATSRRQSATADFPSAAQEKSRQKDTVGSTGGQPTDEMVQDQFHKKLVAWNWGTEEHSFGKARPGTAATDTTVSTFEAFALETKAAEGRTHWTPSPAPPPPVAVRKDSLASVTFGEESEQQQRQQVRRQSIPSAYAYPRRSSIQDTSYLSSTTMSTSQLSVPPKHDEHGNKRDSPRGPSIFDVMCRPVLCCGPDMGRRGSSGGQRSLRGPAADSAASSVPITSTPAIPVDPPAQHRERIRRQLRHVFVYPIAYMVCWLVPSVAQIMSFYVSFPDEDSLAGNGDRLPTRPDDVPTVHGGSRVGGGHVPFVVLLLAMVSLAIGGTVNAWLFLARERPWRHAKGRSFWRELGAMLRAAVPRAMNPVRSVAVAALHGASRRPGGYRDDPNDGTGSGDVVAEKDMDNKRGTITLPSLFLPPLHQQQDERRKRGTRGNNSPDSRHGRRGSVPTVGLTREEIRIESQQARARREDEIAEELRQREERRINILEGRGPGPAARSGVLGAATWGDIASSHGGAYDFTTARRRDEVREWWQHAAYAHDGASSDEEDLLEQDGAADRRATRRSMGFGRRTRL